MSVRTGRKQRRMRGSLGFERLEARRMMAADITVVNDVLKITGTGQGERITVEDTSAFIGPVRYAMVRATIADAAGNVVLTRSFNPQVRLIPLTSVRIDAMGGDDVVVLRTSLPSDVRGGDGNDQLTGGAGVDRLWGGSGDDTLWGGNGNDTLIAIGGGQRDVLWGQAGSDSFWLDSEATERIEDATAAEIAADHIHRVAAFAVNTIVSPAGIISQAPSRELNGPNLLDPLRKDDAEHAAFVLRNRSSQSLFDADGPSRDDVVQGAVGDCYFMAALAAIAQTNPDRIRQLVADLGDGTYAVHFHDAAGGDAFVRVDGDLYADPNASPAPSDKPNADLAYGRGDLWANVVEKAWAFYRNNKGTYDSIVGGTSPGIKTEDALGLHYDYFSNAEPTAALPGVFATAADYFDAITDQWNAGKAVVLSGPSGLKATTLQTYAAPAWVIAKREQLAAAIATQELLGLSGGSGTYLAHCRDELKALNAAYDPNVYVPEGQHTYRRGQHVYTVISTDVATSTVKLYNPYGSIVDIPANLLFFVSRGMGAYTV